MRLLIYEGKDKVGAFVAQYVKEKICSFVPTPERPFYVLGLPTGGTPKPVYAAPCGVQYYSAVALWWHAPCDLHAHH